MWVGPENKDPLLLHAPTRRSVACFGAVNLRTGQFVRHVCSVFNAQTFRRFLKQLLRYRRGRRRMIVVLDNRPLSSRRAAEALPAAARQTAATAVPAALQPPARLDRAGLEAGSASGHSQPLLPDTRRGRQGRERLLRSLASAKSSAKKAMLHYLRRRV